MSALVEQESNTFTSINAEVYGNAVPSMPLVLLQKCTVGWLLQCAGM